MTFHAATTARLLGAFVIILVIGSTVIQALGAYFGYDTIYGLVPFFELDSEQNLPTWYSSLMLLFSAALLALIAVAERTTGIWARHWLGLSVIFLALSVDEVSSIHEKFNRPVRELLRLPSSVYFAWSIAAAPVLLIVAVTYARWFFSLPPRMRKLTFVSGVLYIGGALGFELAGALFTSREQNSFAYQAVATMEETLEMCGVVVWIYTLIDYAASRGIRSDVRFTS